MNQTTEDSRQFAILVGGETIPKEDGTVEIPPQKAITTQSILESIKQGEYVEIKAEAGRAQDILNKEQLNELENNVNKRPDKQKQDKQETR